MDKFLPAKVRRIIYIGVAAILTILAIQGWVSPETSQTIQDALGFLLGVGSLALATANIPEDAPKE